MELKDLLSKIEDDTYTYYLKYIAKIPPDRFDGIYAKSGGDIHECIEAFYNGELDHQGMLDKYEDLLFENTLNGLKYDRSDEEKNKSIGEKYENCIRHFLLNHNKIPYKIKLENFIGVVIGTTGSLISLNKYLKEHNNVVEND